MKRILNVLYGVCVGMVVGLFLCLCGEFRNEVFQTREDSGYVYLTEYKQEKVEDRSAPVGVKNEYVIQQLDIPEGGRNLIFYTIHQNVEVYIGKELVYSIRPAESNPFGKTPGNIWNVIPIYEKDAGKEIRIVIIPVYESSIDIVPDFYFGARVGIWAEVMRRNLLALILSVLAIVSGIILVVFGLLTRRSVEMNKGLTMMGMFALNIGIWKLSESDAMAMVFRNSIVLAYIPFLALLLVVVPFVLYMKNLFAKESRIWYVPCFISIFVIMISIVLQITGIADFRQTLWMNHMVMGTVIVVGLFMLIRELRMVGWSRHLKIMVICMSSCLVGMLGDIAIYYGSNGATMTVMGMLGFLIYIIVLGVISIKEVRKLMSIGKQAKRYEQMAYHDQLTGLYNRAAYADYIGRPEFKSEHCILVMFDLNNLKYCNDTWGHEMGDSYIVNSAELIYDAFGSVGKCYRMGGDEFCVLLKEVSLKKCENLVKKLQKETEIWNSETKEKFQIQIACGYAQFDEDMDYDLGDTLRRADKMMYHEKFKMKQE